jgi:hypothetical protein
VHREHQGDQRQGRQPEQTLVQMLHRPPVEAPPTGSAISRWSRSRTVSRLSLSFPAVHFFITLPSGESRLKENSAQSSAKRAGTAWGSLSILIGASPLAGHLSQPGARSAPRAGRSAWQAAGSAMSARPTSRPGPRVSAVQPSAAGGLSVRPETGGHGRRRRWLAGLSARQALKAGCCRVRPGSARRAVAAARGAGGGERRETSGRSRPRRTAVRRRSPCRA